MIYLWQLTILSVDLDEVKHMPLIHINVNQIQKQKTLNLKKVCSIRKWSHTFCESFANHLKTMIICWCYMAQTLHLQNITKHKPWIVWFIYHYERISLWEEIIYKERILFNLKSYGSQTFMTINAKIELYHCH